MGVCARAFRVAAPYGGESGLLDCLQALREPGSGAAGANHAEANLLSL